MERVLGLPCLAAVRLSQACAVGFWRRKSTAASEKAHLRCALPLFVPEVPVRFAGGYLSALDQAGVGSEVLDGREAADVVDLVEDDEGEDLPDAGDGAQAIEGIGVVLPGGAEDGEFQLVEGMTEHEGNPLLLTQVGEPVPGEHALGGHSEILAVGSEDLENRPWAGSEVLVDLDVSGLVQDTDVEGSGVEIDAAVVEVLLGIESHRGLLLEGW
jgi:hypothetical protein